MGRDKNVGQKQTKWLSLWAPSPKSSIVPQFLLNDVSMSIIVLSYWDALGKAQPLDQCGPQFAPFISTRI